MKTGARQNTVRSNPDKTNSLLRFLLCFSTANLLMLSVWKEILFMKSESYYFLLSAPSAPDYLAAVANTIWIALLLWGVLEWVQKSNRRWLMAITSTFFVILLLIPLNTIRLVVPFQLGIGVLSERIRRAHLLIPVLLLVAGSGIMMLRFRRVLLRGVVLLVLILTPFGFMTIAQALMKAVSTPVKDQPSQTIPPVRKATAYQDEVRIVWMIFDELSESIMFSQRPPGLELPAMDRFRTESVQVTQARSPSSETFLSIPSLLTGIPMSKAYTVGMSKLKVIPKGSSEAASLSSIPNVFTLAREARMETTVVGWFHPYCRLFDGSLDHCSSRPVFETVIGQVTAEDKTILISMGNQVRALSPFVRRSLAIDAYQKILADSNRAVSIASGIVFLHFSIPHAPVIYDRKNGKLTSFALSNIRGYVDNVALVDRTFAELRESMEESGQWQRTVVILSSDHPWRDKPEYDGSTDSFVPFLVSMPDRTGPIELNFEFDTVYTKELIAAIIQRKITDNASVAEWLRANSSAQ